MLKKRIAALFLAGLLCGTVLAGCGFAEKEIGDTAEIISDVIMEEDGLLPDNGENDGTLNADTVAQDPDTVETPYEYRGQSHGYQNLLTENEEALYEEIDRNIHSIGVEKNDSGLYDISRITVWNELTETEIKVAITAYKNDHPEVFWLANVYGRASQDGNTMLYLYSYVSPEECETMIREMNSKVQSIVESIGEEKSEFDRELLAFQAVADHCAYDTETASGEAKDWQSYTAYGALINGKAVCEGYSRAMQLLLSYLDMECRLIHGTADGAGHMWDLVRVGGDWYHLDATWNDQKDVVIYDYFNVTDHIIQKDHTIGPELDKLSTEEIDAVMQNNGNFNMNLPSCSRMTENYLKKRGVQISSFSAAENQRVTEAFRDARDSQEPAVYLYISEDIDFDMAINQLLKTRSPQLLIYLQRANKGYGAAHFDDTQVRYIISEQARSVTVMLDYLE